VLRRIDCVLAPTKKNVLKKYDELKDEIENLYLVLKHESGYAFYNTSKYDFRRLLDDPANIQKNLIDYINGFSESMRDILDRFKIRNTIQTLHEKGSLYPALRDTENVPLGESVYGYVEREVKPHVPDAWIDESVVDAKDGGVGSVGYEINFNRYFYTYTPPRPLAEIEAEIKNLEAEILGMVREMMG
jgi:hypothetical protein